MGCAVTAESKAKPKTKSDDVPKKSTDELRTGYQTSSRPVVKANNINNNQQSNTRQVNNSSNRNQATVSVSNNHRQTNNNNTG